MINRRIVISQLSRTEGWLSEHEGLLLYTLARGLNGEGDIVEIGSWKGRSTVCLGLGIVSSGRQRQLLAIDPHRGSLISGGKAAENTYSDFRQAIGHAGLTGVVKPLKTTSAAASAKWGGRASMVFIDGLHDYAHTRQDYLLWHPKIMPGGILAFHDAFCGQAGVMQAVESHILNSRTFTDIGTVGSILYTVNGTPGMLRSLIVGWKIFLIRLSHMIYRSEMPPVIRVILIHRIIRIMLMNRRSARVYLPFL
ncbi:hypothetical protein A2Z33_04685 [Candidatus Gottesmanbacteria bacterium RBG_16_52_11]|uniref:Class I SAM-dependent methyltransferase n=1 Tax=Candidatus Gottesmanbacteria bacterium RBG_16_52_11 TaxID=1798374 RepID=A0A1F5YUH5_9BACT|nr:MAG: hypothetical protein A2Z33_04685 [Candidatus Gottesmanbacteria bacterium RBG_16_52_11]